MTKGNLRAAKASAAERQKRVHYGRLLRHIGQLQRYLGGWDVLSHDTRGVNYESYARSLRELARGLNEILSDLESEKWTPALLEKLDREAALAALKKDLPTLEKRAQSGGPSDYARFAKARRRKKTLLGHEQKVRRAG